MRINKTLSALVVLLLLSLAATKKSHKSSYVLVDLGPSKEDIKDIKSDFKSLNLVQLKEQKEKEGNKQEVEQETPEQELYRLEDIKVRINRFLFDRRVKQVNVLKLQELAGKHHDFTFEVLEEIAEKIKIEFGFLEIDDKIYISTIFENNIQQKNIDIEITNEQLITQSTLQLLVFYKSYTIGKSTVLNSVLHKQPIIDENGIDVLDKSPENLIKKLNVVLDELKYIKSDIQASLQDPQKLDQIIKHQFRRVDTNQNDSVSVEELDESIQNLVQKYDINFPSSEVIYIAFKFYDKNQNNSLDINEFEDVQFGILVRSYSYLVKQISVIQELKLEIQEHYDLLQPSKLSYLSYLKNQRDEMLSILKDKKSLSEFLISQFEKLQQQNKKGISLEILNEKIQYFKMVYGVSNLPSQKVVKLMFQFYDKNQNGFLEQNEAVDISFILFMRYVGWLQMQIDREESFIRENELEQQRVVEDINYLQKAQKKIINGLKDKNRMIEIFEKNFDKIDNNKDKNISYTEFLVYLAKLELKYGVSFMPNSNETFMVFSFFDKNKSGAISKQESIDLLFAVLMRYFGVINQQLAGQERKLKQLRGDLEESQKYVVVEETQEEPKEEDEGKLKRVQQEDIDNTEVNIDQNDVKKQKDYYKKVNNKSSLSPYDLDQKIAVIRQNRSRILTLVSDPVQRTKLLSDLWKQVDKEQEGLCRLHNFYTVIEHFEENYAEFQMPTLQALESYFKFLSKKQTNISLERKKFDDLVVALLLKYEGYLAGSLSALQYKLQIKEYQREFGRTVYQQLQSNQRKRELLKEEIKNKSLINQHILSNLNNLQSTNNQFSIDQLITLVYKLQGQFNIPEDVTENSLLEVIFAFYDKDQDGLLSQQQFINSAFGIVMQYHGYLSQKISVLQKVLASTTYSEALKQENEKIQSNFDQIMNNQQLLGIVYKREFKLLSLIRVRPVFQNFVQTLMSQLDVDQSYDIGYEELELGIDLICEELGFQSPSNIILMSMFRFYDQDDSGYIDETEIVDLAYTLTIRGYSAIRRYISELENEIVTSLVRHAYPKRAEKRSELFFELWRQKQREEARRQERINQGLYQQHSSFERKVQKQQLNKEIKDILEGVLVPLYVVQDQVFRLLQNKGAMMIFFDKQFIRFDKNESDTLNRFEVTLCMNEIEQEWDIQKPSSEVMDLSFKFYDKSNDGQLDQQESVDLFFTYFMRFFNEIEGRVASYEIELQNIVEQLTFLQIETM